MMLVYWLKNIRKTFLNLSKNNISRKYSNISFYIYSSSSKSGIPGFLKNLVPHPQRATDDVRIASAVIDPISPLILISLKDDEVISYFLI